MDTPVMTVHRFVIEVMLVVDRKQLLVRFLHTTGREDKIGPDETLSESALRKCCSRTCALRPAKKGNLPLVDPNPMAAPGDTLSPGELGRLALSRKMPRTFDPCSFVSLGHLWKNVLLQV